ncbi:MAG: hypothetical protein QGH70_06000, partial [Nitrospinota bacterium]|nr:hypothetical protein [Nitrospinota bacterium]
DLAAKRRILDQDMANRSGWTPFHGREVTGWPMATIIRGRIVMRDRQLEGIDEEEVFARARERAAKLWERF